MSDPLLELDVEELRKYAREIKLNPQDTQGWALLNKGAQWAWTIKREELGAFRSGYNELMESNKQLLHREAALKKMMEQLQACLANYEANIDKADWENIAAMQKEIEFHKEREKALAEACRALYGAFQAVTDVLRARGELK